MLIQFKEIFERLKNYKYIKIIRAHPLAFCTLDILFLLSKYCDITKTKGHFEYSQHRRATRFLVKKEMTKITQVSDRSAATAWSPVANCAGVIALGAKVRTTDEDR